MLIDAYIPSNIISSDSNGIMSYYDNMRNMSLSFSKNILKFGLNHNNISGKRYMSLISDISSMSSSYTCFRNGIITAISIKCKNQTNTSFKILGNDIEIYSTSLNNENNKIIDDLTVNFSKYDIIQCELNSMTFINFPVVMLEIAWKY